MFSSFFNHILSSNVTSIVHSTGKDKNTFTALSSKFQEKTKDGDGEKEKKGKVLDANQVKQAHDQKKKEMEEVGNN